MSKEEIQEHLNRIRRDADQIQDEQRRIWLRQIVREAEERYGFGSLGELIAFIVDHVALLQESSGAHENVAVRSQQRRRLQVSEVPGESEEVALKFG